ncbi:DUF3793 family protein [Clostridium cadaveris]
MCAVVKSLYETLKEMNDKDYIEKFLVYNLSIVIEGSKPSATVTLKKDCDNTYGKWMEHGRKFIDNIGLNYIVLREDLNSAILLIYNAEILKSYLFTEKSYQFLTGIGYSLDQDLESYLSKLKERYSLYHCPHELGIFLGYPINDVKDFMKCTSKQCLMCGYWKVYNDVDYAVKVFEKYDTIKKQAAQSIIHGLQAHDLVYKLKKIDYSA